MTILLVLRTETGATETATDCVVTSLSESTPGIDYEYQHNIVAASPSTPTVTVYYEQPIKTASKSEPMATYEIS